MTNETLPNPVVIAGGGFAGIVAANDLADAGIPVLLLDENARLGGQLLRRPPPEWRVDDGGHADRVKRQGFRFVDALERKAVVVKSRTRVLAIYPENEILIEEEAERRTRALKPSFLLLATGARERFLPFPGWTLPGVISCGAVQVLLKSHGVRPAPEMVIAGSGLFLFAAAYECLRHGLTVSGVLESSSLTRQLPLLAQLPFQPAKLAEGMRFLGRLALAGVPIHHRRRVLEARGEGQLEEIVTVGVDGRGAAVPGSEKAQAADCLAISNGFAPNLELAQLAACQLDYHDDLGGWIVRVNDELETTQANLFAAGELTGVAGALKSACEGHIAALAILNRLGKVKPGAFESRLARLQRERRRHLRFGRCFNSLYSIPAPAWAEIPDPTILCRCEEVSAGELRRAVLEGFTSPAALKVPLRAAMGDCQGRTCGPVISDMLSALTRRPPTAFGSFSVRPPVKPVSFETLSRFGS